MNETMIGTIFGVDAIWNCESVGPLKEGDEPRGSMIEMSYRG
jgi:hypothetical protein